MQTHGSILAPVPLIETPPSGNEVRAALSLVLGSTEFDTSDRNREFLRYVVEETLAGRADHIKGYSVALSVFKRDADFDPQLDPVVRIEAARLRRALDRYYLTAGSTDPTRISLPKGGYVPTFRSCATGSASVEPSPCAVAPTQPQPAVGPYRRGPYVVAAVVITLTLIAGASVFGHMLALASFFMHATDTSTSAQSWSRSGMQVVVVPFANLSDDRAQDYVARSITDELVAALTHLSGLSVLAATDINRRVPGAAPPADIPSSMSAGFILRGTIRPVNDQIHISVELIDASDGRFVWVRSFDRMVNGESIVPAANELAAALAAKFAVLREQVALPSGGQVAP